jgi:hypothetical protein
MHITEILFILCETLQQHPPDSPVALLVDESPAIEVETGSPEIMIVNQRAGFAQLALKFLCTETFVTRQCPYSIRHRRIFAKYGEVAEREFIFSRKLGRLLSISMVCLSCLTHPASKVRTAHVQMKQVKHQAHSAPSPA